MKEAARFIHKAVRLQVTTKMAAVGSSETFLSTTLQGVTFQETVFLLSPFTRQKGRRPMVGLPNRRNLTSEMWILIYIPNRNAVGAIFLNSKIFRTKMNIEHLFTDPHGLLQNFNSDCNPVSLVLNSVYFLLFSSSVEWHHFVYYIGCKHLLFS
jgi:hypothetical protein